jgi:hypothetical protein
MSKIGKGLSFRANLPLTTGHGQFHAMILLNLLMAAKQPLPQRYHKGGPALHTLPIFSTLSLSAYQYHT